MTPMMRTIFMCCRETLRAEDPPDTTTVVENVFDDDQRDMAIAWCQEHQRPGEHWTVVEGQVPDRREAGS